jgi:DNA-binding NarL/FixJ family response regulator
MPICRILVVEDHLPVRQFICSTLNEREDFQIVAETGDGLDALAQATALQPDVVVLDVGLPKLNGLDAARQILQAVPHCRILFLSLESSSAIVQEALSAGAVGYVHKLYTARDLLNAIDAICRGEQFVSAELVPAQGLNFNPRHEVQFYSDDAVCVERIARFIIPALTSGNGAIVIVTRPHAEQLERRLHQQRIDLAAAAQNGSYVSLDASETVAGVMVSGVPDREAFRNGLENLVETVSRATKAENPRVSIVGECAGLLCEDGNTQAALQLEKTGNELLKTHNVEILCVYNRRIFDAEEKDRAFMRICNEHSAVLYH